MIGILKRMFLVSALCSTAFSVAASETDLAPWLKAEALAASQGRSDEKAKLRWFDASTLSIEGKSFSDTLTSYSRIPNRYRESVTKGVWGTGSNSAGITIRFVTDSPGIHAIWNNDPPMGHMAWTGSGGLDLYERVDDEWVFRSVARPTTITETMAELKVQNAEGKPKEYLLFLPLYSKVDKLELGIEEGAALARGPDRYTGQLPIVFYGTSITQGGCASRAGIAHPSLIRRWFDYPVYNLGFSGAGKGEPVMADMLAEIPAAIYIMETVSNMGPEMIAERVVPFMQRLREKRPDTPILMIESPNGKREEGSNAAYKAQFETLRQQGMDKLFYLASSDIYSGRENPTVDGSHPTDLGFYEMAVSYERELKKLLNFEPGQTAILKPQN